MHLAVTLAVAVASAVLTGALLIGDSVRGSLLDLTLERLGQIEYSLSSGRYFREVLAHELQKTVDADVVPAIILQGSAVHADSSRRTSGVTVLGIDASFLQLFPTPGGRSRLNLNLIRTGRLQRSVAINESLQKELRADVGDFILLSFDKKSAVHPEFILGSRDPSDLYQTLRVKIGQIVPDRSIGRFSLSPNQASPYNVYLPLETLQQALVQEERVNTLLVSDDVSLEMLQRELGHVATLEDFGLRWREGSPEPVLESREMLISPMLEEDIWKATEDLKIPAQPVLTYLANEIGSETGSIPYSTVSAIDLERTDFRNRLRLVSGEASPELDSDEILLNAWAARDLGIAPGDSITLTYYVADWQEELTARSTALRVRGIVAMEGLAVDQALTPSIPGVQDASDMASWRPPIPIDFSRIRRKDEEYWDQYKTAPKAFLSYRTGLALWQNRFGRITSVRFPESGPPRDEIEAALLHTLKPDRIGRFRASKEEGLQAATGSTDFGMLFIGFSLFLIISAVLLVGLLFRLGAENRARELGLFLSLGYSPRAVRNRFLIEGILLALTGSLIGLGLSWAYARLLIKGLETLWIAAIGGSFLSLHVEYATLIFGGLAALMVVLLSLLLTLRHLTKVPATALLKGAIHQREVHRSRTAGVCFSVSLGVAVILLLFSFFLSADSSAVVFFLMGAALLVSGLSLFAIWLRLERPVGIKPDRVLSRIRMAVRNSARSPGRSLLSVALVGSACFVIVAVGANRIQPGTDILDKASGSGGFTIRAQADVPIVRDLNSPESLSELGFDEAEIEKLQQIDFFAYRLRPGEDISCRNLYRPREPRLLGVPEKQLERGGFRFQSLLYESDDPWAALRKDLGPDVVPAFGDASSVQWILHRALGDDLIIRNEAGEEIRLRLVGLLARSIFQSELLISEENFEKHFPKLSGYTYFLFGIPPDQIDETTTLLESRLSRYGFDTTSTRQLLAGFFAVENTYLSTFQSLGGLGLLLGTLGLGIILIRNTIERRGELATLRAFGFSRNKLSLLVLLENCFLLGLGIILGSSSALIAVAPHLYAMSEVVPMTSLLATLLAVFIAGTLASVLSLRIALRIPLLSVLKEE